MTENFLKKIFMPVFVVSTIIFSLLTPLLYYSFNMDFYTKQWGQNIEVVQNVYNFLKGKEQLTPLFTIDEKKHLQDVKDVFYIVFVWEIIAVIGILTAILFFVISKKKTYFIDWCLLVSVITLSLLWLLLVSLSFDFQWLFILFHKIFFPQGNWLFAGSSLLIQLFPASFFEAITIRSFLVSLSIPTLLFGYGLYQKNKKFFL